MPGRGSTASTGTAGTSGNCRARCAELGIESAAVQLRLFSTMVDSVMSHGAEVWGVQLAAQAARNNTGDAGSAAERLQLRYLLHLLGVRQSTPNAVVMAETGERPVWRQWLRRAAKFWNKMLREAEGSLVRQALQSSIEMAGRARCLASEPWAAQLAAGMEAVGMPLDLQQPAAIGLAELDEAGQKRQMQQFRQAATRQGASRLQQSEATVGVMTYGAFGQREPYLDKVRQRQLRQPLAQLRTGSHWGAEETGRWAKLPRAQRVCPHCGAGAVEDARHMLLSCALYQPLRNTRFSALFAVPEQSARMPSFLCQDPRPLAEFAAACRKRWQDATAARSR